MNVPACFQNVDRVGGNCPPICCSLSFLEASLKTYVSIISAIIIVASYALNRPTDIKTFCCCADIIVRFVALVAARMSVSRARTAMRALGFLLVWDKIVEKGVWFCAIVFCVLIFPSCMRKRWCGVVECACASQIEDQPKTAKMRAPEIGFCQICAVRVFVCVCVCAWCAARMFGFIGSRALRFGRSAWCASLSVVKCARFGNKRARARNFCVRQTSTWVVRSRGMRCSRAVSTFRARHRDRGHRSICRPAHTSNWELCVRSRYRNIMTETHTESGVKADYRAQY